MELKEVFEPIVNFLKNFQKKEKETVSKDKAKERLQLVLMQDRASVSPDFFEMMKKEIIEVIKKYIEIDEELLEVQLTRGFEDGDGTGPALYANIPIKNIKPVAKKVEEKSEEKIETIEETEDKDKKNNKNKKEKKNKKENVVAAEASEEELQEIKDEIIQEVKDKVESIVKEQTEEAVEKIEEKKEDSKLEFFLMLWYNV